MSVATALAAAVDIIHLAGLDTIKTPLLEQSETFRRSRHVWILWTLTPIVLAMLGPATIDIGWNLYSLLNWTTLSTPPLALWIGFPLSVLWLVEAFADHHNAGIHVSVSDEAVA